MSNVIVLNKPAQLAEPLSAGSLAEPLREPGVDHAVLVDCVEDAMDAIAVRMRLLRRDDQPASESSPWRWKQLARIENRLGELQVALKSIRARAV